MDTKIAEIYLSAIEKTIELLRQCKRPEEFGQVRDVMNSLNYEYVKHMEKHMKGGTNEQL